MADRDQAADEEYQRRVERRLMIMQAKAEIAAKEKTYKAEDKSDGYDEKCLNSAAKCKFKGAVWYADQLEFELEIKTTREAAGLPITSEDARKAADAEADALRRGDPATYEKRFGDDEERTEASVFDKGAFSDKPRGGRFN